MNDHSRTFQWRAFTSVLMSLGFLLLAVSGVVLFLAPPGRVANWTNWTMLGLRKGEWGGLHIWFGALFLGMTVLHVVFNWRPLLGYVRNRATRSLGWRREWVAAILLCAVVWAGTRAGVPPFSTLLAWNEHLKESWDRPAERAPIPHAELLTLAGLAEKGGVDPATASARLAARGFRGFTSETIVQQIAESGNVPAREIYDMIAPVAKPGGGHGEGRAGGGPGWKTLAQFCAEEGLAIDTVRARLKAKNLRFDEQMTVREIAQLNGQKAYELVESLR